MEGTTLEWFGGPNFRLRTAGLTIFLDSWLERPSVLPQYIRLEDITEADYILISHAHFDHLPGADKLALQTGATVIASNTAIACLERAGVPAAQLQPVSGGERIALFSRSVLEAARAGRCALHPASPPGAPPRPHPSLAVAAVHVWPALHCLMPWSHEGLPETFDTGIKYEVSPEQTDWGSTVEINRGMEYGLLKIGKHVLPEHRDEGLQSFVSWLEDEKRHRGCFSSNDGGQLMYNFLLPEPGCTDVGATLSTGLGGLNVLLWNGHLGGYEGIMRSIKPKPDVAILGAAGIGNKDGRPFGGSAAEFLEEEIKWLDNPERVIWCLHDEFPMKPRRVDTTAAKDKIEGQNPHVNVMDLQHGKVYRLF